MEQLTLFTMGYTGAPPTKAYHDDAGFDLAVDGNHTVRANQFAQIPLQTRLLAPPGYWLLLVGRSSSFQRHGLLINVGVIDPSYTGPLFAVCRNLTVHPVQIAHGERLCQAIPIALADVPTTEFQQFPPTGRGENGFGSSGR